jgi:hypothetical protein
MYGIKRAIAAAPPYELFPYSVLSEEDQIALRRRRVEETKKIELAWVVVSQRLSKVSDGMCEIYL